MTALYWPCLASVLQVESLRYDRRGNLLATYNGGISYWNFERGEGGKQELALPYAGACLCGDVTPGALRCAFIIHCADHIVHVVLVHDMLSRRA